MTEQYKGRANIINFIRYDHGMKTIEHQMREIRQRGLPATWLLQYDALVAGPYVDYLKENAPADHEIGLWFEVVRMHCDDAGVEFRGEDYPEDHEPDTLNWDHRSRAMMSCGYSQGERIRLIDTMMRRFEQVFGKPARSVAAWYIDSFCLEYLAVEYGIVATANCREQWGTDGYAHWGGPVHGFYYPSTFNALVPGADAEHQTRVPLFRMLNVDPVDAHDLEPSVNGQPVLTLEPACAPGGGNPEWIRRYFDLMLNGQTRPFAHFQVGQENDFPWSRIGPGLCYQFDELLRRSESGELVVETLEATGRYCLEQYPLTPVGTLHGDRSPGGTDKRSIWYHSRRYRALIQYSDKGLAIDGLDLYSPDDIERNYLEPLNTYNVAFEALPMTDCFLFGSRIHLTGSLPDGDNFDERNCAIQDLRVTQQEDNLVIEYANAIGVRSRIVFLPEEIRIVRSGTEGMHLMDRLSYNKAFRFQPFMGSFRNEVVFGWKNEDYRMEVTSSEKVLHAFRQGHVVLGEGTKNSECIFRFKHLPARMPSTNREAYHYA